MVKRVIARDATSAEATTIKEAANWVNARGWQQAHLISDARTVVQGISGRCNTLDRYTNEYIDCRASLGNSLKLDWRPREATRAADILAKAARQALIPLDSPIFIPGCVTCTTDDVSSFWISYLEGRFPLNLNNQFGSVGIG